MYRAFTGHDPDINPYLHYYGLPTTAAAPATGTPQAPQKAERGL
jgi:hypothetical protein